MNITEKISYIKGLCEGLSLDEKKPEVKVINAIIDLLDDIAYDLTDMEELYDEDCDCCDDDDDDYDEDEDFDFDDEDNPFYEVTCGACGQKLNVSEDVLLEGEIECPNCGELLEFDFSGLFDEEEEECDGNCDGCDGCEGEE